jgi:hypothetical protein
MKESEMSIDLDRQVLMTFGVSLNDVVEATSGLSHDEMFELIKALDLSMADYEFTLRLRDHFSREIDVCDSEMYDLEEGDRDE